MREALSKRTKSRSASPSAAPKRPHKTSSSKSANVSPRQKPAIQVAPVKSSAKATLLAKTQKKAAPAKKKTPTGKNKKTVPPPARVTATKKASPKAPSKSIKVAKKAIQSKVKAQTNAPKVKPQTNVPKVKLRANVPKASRSTLKSAIAPTRIPRQQTATQALRAFERAVKAFNLRQFSEAKALFEEVQQRYHQEVEITSRSQTYIQVCNVRLARNRILPRNADEFYDQGVVALNVGNFVQARSFFEKALKLRPDDSHTLYSLAATHAQTGSTDQALTYLQQAVQRQPRLRQQALQDTDFLVLKEDRRFLELLGATSPFDLLEARRDLS
jgi:tetratricopeptide (TPR) repeat protein